MDFTFTRDQTAFRDAMRSFFLVEAAPELLREMWDTDGSAPELTAKCAQQGITGLSVGESFGGLGLGDVDWVLILEELGYFAIPDSLCDTAYIAAGLISALPEHESFKAEWLPRIAEGSARIAVGHPENRLVADAHLADLLLLGHQNEVHAVRRDEVTLVANTSVDPSRRLYGVDWIPKSSTCLANSTIGGDLWLAALDRGTLATAAQLVGLASRMLDLAIDYTAQRKQFGKPIGSFQAIKHLLADVAVKIEFAKPHVFRAAHALAHGHAERGTYLSSAKLAASEAASLASRNGIQVHGAMGYTWELDLQMYMKRALALSASWGDRAFHKNRVAEFVFRESAPLGPGNTFNFND
ncbi:acyl-CoA dehydrogenase family protein [Paraburkholderia sacchari]|uniref:acyl-CoA dehydrogenase family protein n=1 Tax=Paraburkholderia sacchari TaxID=159450 RepID=UPI0005432955|nr:acyl-CoA dehydrogenase family protein [Paraburkholderia sacchari]NLP64863.1 acyl-CoA/acyl-ACP dehydrogenase [Paraburkholderia sacchari]